MRSTGSTCPSSTRSRASSWRSRASRTSGRCTSATSIGSGITARSCDGSDAVLKFTQESLCAIQDSAPRPPMSADEEIAAGEQALGQLDDDSAYKHFDKAIKADPTSAIAHFGKAEAALGVPKVEAGEVLGLYKKAIELD